MGSHSFSSVVDPFGTIDHGHQGFTALTDFSTEKLKDGIFLVQDETSPSGTTATSTKSC
jgi:hypothetical protein